MTTKTPIEQGVIARAIAGIRYTVSGATPEGWFSPGQPLAPVAQDKPEVEGRRFDFATGINLRMQPKTQEGVTFAQLRALADGYDLLRLIIETRKDEITKLRFVIKPMDKEAEADDRCQEVMDFLKFPDKEHSWDDWLRMLIEDLLVLDAPTLYPRMTKGGTLYALEPVDGATIKRVIDGGGRTPIPPEVAYQQVIKGLPAVDYSRDELIYKPRNLRTNKIYGYSPVEQIIMTVNIAMRRQLYQLQYYTEGSTPDMIMQVPEGWNPDQIKQFYDWWHSMLAGNTAGRSKTMFVPSGVTPFDTKDKALMDQFDEWLARIVCFALGVSPTAFVKQTNRATAQTAEETAQEQGIAPIAAWIKRLIDYVTWKYFGYTDLEFAWADEKDPDLLEQAQINQIYLQEKVITADEVRHDLGKQPLTAGQKSELAPEPPPPTVEPPNATPKGAQQPGGTGKVEKAQKKSPYAKLNR